MNHLGQQNSFMRLRWDLTRKRDCGSATLNVFGSGGPTEEAGL